VANTYAVQVLDDERNDRLVARILHTLTYAINNALRTCGKPVPDDHYRPEESFMPTMRVEQQAKKPTGWRSVVGRLFPKG